MSPCVEAVDAIAESRSEGLLPPASSLLHMDGANAAERREGGERPQPPALSEGTSHWRGSGVHRLATDAAFSLRR